MRSLFPSEPGSFEQERLEENMIFKILFILIIAIAMPILADISRSLSRRFFRPSRL